MTGNSVTRRRIVEIGGGLVVVSGLGGLVTADEHENDTDEPVTDDHEEDERPGVARIRAAHLSPDAPNVDVYVDGELALENAAYRDVSEYLEFEVGSYTVQIVPAGEDPDQAVIEETVDAEEGDFTVAAIGELAGDNQPLQALVLEDDNSPVEPDTARVRAVHAAPDAPAVDVVAGENGDALFENVAFGESGYTEVPEGEYTLFIFPAGDRAEAVFEVDVTLAGGTVYSAFAIGYLAPERAPADEPFEILLTEDARPEEEDVEPDEPREDEREKEEPEDELAEKDDYEGEDEKEATASTYFS
ncbi:DUF4397 domain-containing protein [Natrialbaceae archaeon A-gly3]